MCKIVVVATATDSVKSLDFQAILNGSLGFPKVLYFEPRDITFIPQICNELGMTPAWTGAGVKMLKEIADRKKENMDVLLQVGLAMKVYGTPRVPRRRLMRSSL